MVHCLFIFSEELTSDSTLPSNAPTNQITFCSDNPLRLVEIYDENNGEVTWCKEIHQSENTFILTLDLLKIITEKGFNILKGSVWDCYGNCRTFEFRKNIFDLIE